MHNRNAHQMWNNGQGWQAYGDLNLRTWYQSDLVTITDQAMTKHYFIAGQRIASKLAESLEPEVARSLKDKPVTPLSGDIRDLAEATAARIARDFDCVGIDYNAFYPGDVRLEALETLLNAPEQPAEYQVFFYHSDHLGSSSFITDANGDATQHLQYLPFGEDLVHEQNTAAYLSPYTFSGKERDVETNLSYFGARYYESSLSVWLSVDPMSDKYPSLSPYNYCAWNPVMLVDPDGRQFGDFFDSEGNHLGNDGIDDGKIYIVNGSSRFSLTDFKEGGKYYNNHVDFNKNNGDGYSISEIGLDSEVGMLARIGYAEFRGSNSTEQKVGMDITLNRVESSRYPNTLEGVIEQPWQYSSLNEGDPNKAYYENPVSTLTNSSNRNAWSRAVSNSISVLNGNDRGISQGATLYYSPRSMVPSGSQPNWNFKILSEINVQGVRSSHLKLFRER